MVSGNAEPYGREGLPLEEARERVVEALQPITARSTVHLEPVSYTHLTLPTKA